jgi:hypothetical protein
MLYNALASDTSKEVVTSMSMTGIRLPGYVTVTFVLTAVAYKHLDRRDPLPSL